MYGIFLIFMVNVGKYTIHGWYDFVLVEFFTCTFFSTSGGGASFETTLNGQVIGGEFSLYFMAFVHTLALGKNSSVWRMKKEEVKILQQLHIG